MLRLLHAQAVRLFDDLVRDPRGKWNAPAHMMTGRCVLFMNLRELIGWQVVRKSNQGRPESPMHERYLSVDQATNQNVRRVADTSKDIKDLMALWMSPPTPPDRLTRNCVRQTRNRSLGRSENDAMLSNERQRFVGGHARPFIHPTLESNRA